jgi:transposase
MSEASENYIIDKNGVKRRARRSYTSEFKRQIVALYETGGYTREQLLREYDLTETALSRWIRQSRNSGSFKEKDNRTPEENELIRLNKEIKQLRMENDILKQAALIFGRKENQR